MYDTPSMHSEESQTCMRIACYSSAVQRVVRCSGVVDSSRSAQCSRIPAVGVRQSSPRSPLVLPREPCWSRASFPCCSFLHGWDLLDYFWLLPVARSWILNCLGSSLSGASYQNGKINWSWGLCVDCGEEYGSSSIMVLILFRVKGCLCRRIWSHIVSLRGFLCFDVHSHWRQCASSNRFVWEKEEFSG